MGNAEVPKPPLQTLNVQPLVFGVQPTWHSRDTSGKGKEGGMEQQLPAER